MSAQRIVAGFIPLLDCAVLVAAAECGFAAQEGIDLRLLRETSWANIRDRLIVGQLQAAHMLGPMVVAATLGAGHLRVPMLASVALGQGGNAISISSAMYREMHGAHATHSLDPATQGAALKRAIRARLDRGAPLPVFATVYPFSCHTFEMRYWLAACGIDPDQDVQLVVLPPPLLVDALRTGQIDGFCVGEPWSSVAVAAGVGHVITTATHIWQGPPEKVLGMRRDWAEAHDDVALALVRAVLRAAEWSNNANNHRELASLLAGPRYVGVPAELLYAGLSGQLRLAPDALPVAIPDFMGFTPDAALPSAAHAAWYYRQMVRWGQCVPEAGAEIVARSCFDDFLCRRAAASLGWSMPESERLERLFDGQSFDVLHSAGA
jgi:NitT/TauT family transport system ATP-binding protein